MNIALLLARVQRTVSPDFIRQFRQEQQCSIGFAKLPPVRRTLQTGIATIDLLAFIACVSGSCVIAVSLIYKAYTLFAGI